MHPINCHIATALVPYPLAVHHMEARVRAMLHGQLPDCLWHLEHPPLYTAGTAARAEGLLDATRFPVYPTGRGGQYTYHGPGQRVVYAMLDLARHHAPSAPDLHRYIRQLEAWLSAALAHFHIRAQPFPPHVGLWVPSGPNGALEKIAAIGVRVRRWVAYHGIALNVAPDLSHYQGIIPCGMAEYGVTSLQAVLGRVVSMVEVDEALMQSFPTVFAGALLQPASPSWPTI